jgi:fatty acid desaturase
MLSNTNIKRYSRSEVLLHNKKESCWIIIENEVYDLTDFIKEHPGGSNIILSRAGEDATSYFKVKHGLNLQINEMLQKFKLGELLEEERTDVKFLDESFTKALLLAIKEEKLYEVDQATKRKFLIFRVLAVVSFFTLSVFALYANIPLSLAVFFVVLQAIIGTSLFGFIAHESTHRNFPKNVILRYLLELIWPVLWPFISKEPLNYEHNSHHVKIGDEDYDFEVSGFSAFIRYSSAIEKTFWHRYQHRLAVLFYPFYANIITTIGGVSSAFWVKHNRTVALYHIASLAVTFVYYVLIPSIFLGFSFKWIGLYLVYQCVLFTGVYVGAAINHFIPQAFQKIEESKAKLYGFYICSNTSNFGANNPFWFWYTGGFNIQIEHHLAPFVPVENLRKLVPIVKRICQEYDYPYIDFPNFNALWKEHYSFLEELSKGERNIGELENKRRYQAK